MRLRKPITFVNDLKKNSFARNVLMITSGAVFAQALNLVLSPVITRLYTPDEYGVLTVYIALLGLINLLGALSYEDAIPIAQDDEKAFNVLTLCLFILTGLTTILFVLMFFAGTQFLAIFKAEEIVQYKYTIPIGFFLTGFYTIMSQWAFRKKNFKSITATKFSQSISGNGTKIGFGFLNVGAIGLIIGTIISQSAGIVSLIRPNTKNFKQLIKSVSIQEVKKLAKRYIRFPLYAAPGVLILSAAGQMPTIFMSALYGSGIVGLYGLARGITFLPMTIIGKSVQDVFYGEAASITKNNPARIKQLANSLLKKQIILAGIPMLVLILFGPLLFAIVFGPEWAAAGSFARILSIEVFSHFIFHPISTVFSIFEEQKKSFVLYVAKLAAVFLVFLLARLLNLQPTATILLYSVFMAITEFSKYLLAQQIMNSEIKKTDLG